MNSERAKQLLQRLIAESVFAVGAVLSFIIPYDFWLQLLTRPATPASLGRLYYGGLGCVAFLTGLFYLLLFKDERHKIWDVPLWGCLVVGVVAGLLNLISPVVWR